MTECTNNAETCEKEPCCGGATGERVDCEPKCCVDLRTKIFGEICDERAHQEAKWSVDFDDKNTLNDWGAYMTQQLARGAVIGAQIDERTALIKTAAVVVAALEAFDRNGGMPKRHYD